jgi:hypothetical protein
MMTPRILLFPFVLMLAFALPAQNTLDGTWEGFMTVGGIYSDQQLPMQLYLTSEGSEVKGRSYVQLPDGSTLRMDLEGHRYRDLSISLIETDFAGDATRSSLSPTCGTRTCVASGRRKRKRLFCRNDDGGECGLREERLRAFS